MIGIINREPLSKSNRAILGRRIESIRIYYERTLSYNFKRAGTMLKKNILSIPDPEPKDILRCFPEQDRYLEKVFKVVYTGMADKVQPLFDDGTILKSKEVDARRLIMEQWVKKNIGVHIKQIDKTTLNAIQQIMMDTESTIEFNHEIEDYFATSWKGRAYTVARTESACASNVAMNEASKEYDTGRQKMTVWNAFSDELTRQSHLMMDGEEIPFGEFFDVPRTDGGKDKMGFPLDSSMGASAANVVNCRCFESFRYV